MNIIMYHYIRDLKKSKYKHLKVLSIENFKKQIIFLKKNFNFFNPSENIKKNLNKNLFWLTFDDGYIDNFYNVLPILEENNIKGSFFVTSNIQNKKILEVNKIQFIIERSNGIQLLDEIKKIFNNIKKYKKNNEIDLIIKNIRFDHRYDNKTTIIIKKLLQRELDENARIEITDLLFKKYVSKDESEFHKNLYLSVDQLKIMKNLGHEIGNHTENHPWLSRLSKNNQENEIKNNLSFLKKNNLVSKNWTMCYPYGDLNLNTIAILKKLKCSRAVTTIAKKANQKSNLYKLPRFNTNDFYPIS